MKLRLLQVLLVLFVSASLSHCKKKEDTPEAEPAPTHPTTPTQTVTPTDTTKPVKLPTLVTLTVTNINDTSAVTGGSVSAEGESVITAVGVCWDEQPNPTLLKSKTVDGAGIGSYSSSLKKLKPSTTYYVRAYATNASGTAYGNEFSFTTAKNGKWEKWSNGLSGAYTGGPVKSGAIGGNLFMALFADGIYKSSGGANSWSSITSGNSSVGSGFNCMGIKGNDIYAGNSNNSGFFKSSDNGATWNQVNIGNAGVRVSSVEIRGNNIYILCTSNSASQVNGLFLSTNDGASWTNITPPSITGSMDNYYVKATANAIYFGNNGSSSVLKSTNNGGSWTPAANLPMSVSLSQPATPSVTDTDFYVTIGSSIFKTQDGSSWQLISGPEPSGTLRGSVAVDNNNTLYAASGSSVYYTKDQGATWTRLGYGLPSVVLGYVMISNGTIFAAQYYNSVLYKLDL